MPETKRTDDLNASMEWFYSPLFDAELAVPQWEALVTIAVLGMIILITVAGNILVIISVVTHAPLKIAPNFFIVSLAAADIAVSTLVLPLNLIYNVARRWLFGPVVCKMWLTSDVLCCTASILNLCAIALDRYFAQRDPVGHVQRRSVRFVLLVIAGVWLASFLISCPPLLGWNDWPDQADWTEDTPCRLTEKRGYVVYSSMGSFFIPLGIILFTYLNLFLDTRRRMRNREQSAANNLKPTRRKNNIIDKGSGPLFRISAFRTGHRGEDENIEEIHKEKAARRGSGSGNIDTIASALKNTPTELEMEKPNSCAKLPDFLAEKKKLSLAKERRAARTMSIVVGTFILCWLPFFLMYATLPFCVNCKPSNKVIQFITWLGYINSTLNPLIYTVFNNDFRVAFAKILTCK